MGAEPQNWAAAAVARSLCQSVAVQAKAKASASIESIDAELVNALPPAPCPTCITHCAFAAAETRFVPGDVPRLFVFQLVARSCPVGLVVLVGGC
jgi:hypothetical protein